MEIEITPRGPRSAPGGEIGIELGPTEAGLLATTAKQCKTTKSEQGNGTWLGDGGAVERQVVKRLEVAVSATK